MAGPVDLIIVGAGPAGIAAARKALSRKLTVQVLEARPRVGGRVVTRMFAGHPVDLGAHWLHAGPINPVVALCRRLGWPLTRAALATHLFVNGRRQGPAAMASYRAAFDRADSRLSEAARARPEPDIAMAELPPLGRWTRPVAAITGLVCGRPLQHISAADFASAEYAHNFFAPGGFGRLIARLARGLPIRLGAPVAAIDLAGATVRVSGPFGEVEGRRVLVTVPPLVLQRGAIRFTPALPAGMSASIEGFRAAVYEHVLLRWPGAPFRGADRIAGLTGVRVPGIGMLTRLDGTALHYFELDEPLSRGLRAPRDLTGAHLVRGVLATAFGARAISDLQVLHVSDWLGDPLARSSWSTVPPGLVAIRDALAIPVDGRLAFAGEMLDHEQWGTVGAAWASGERAVDALFGA